MTTITPEHPLTAPSITQELRDLRAKVMTDIIGLTKEEALSLCKENGLRVREQGIVGTCDFRQDRLKIVVNRNGIVTSATVG